MTAIPYADVNWPVVTGCARGCPRCWAAGLAHRFGRDFTPTFHPEKLDALPLRGRVIAVAFTGDLFDPAITDAQVNAVLDQVETNAQHVYLLLTKCAKRLPRLLYGQYRDLRHVFIGVSVTSDADRGRVDQLLAVAPSAPRFFVSAEPLRGPLDLAPLRYHLGEGRGVQWVVTAAETGAGGMPLDLAWVRRLRDDCAELGAKFTYKDRRGFPSLDGVTHEWRPAV